MEIESPLNQYSEQPYNEQIITIYHHCPPWAVQHFVGRAVSVVGRVIDIFNEQGYMVFEIDSEKKIQIRVLVDPFKFKYLFDQKQLEKLSYHQEYDFFREYLEPGWTPKKVEDISEWVYVEKEEKEKEKMDIEEKEKIGNKQNSKIQGKRMREQWKLITPSFFKKDQFVEVRGRCISDHAVLMQEFTDFGEDYDLSFHNETLRFIIEQMDEVFY